MKLRVSADGVRRFQPSHSLAPPLDWQPLATNSVERAATILHPGKRSAMFFIMGINTSHPRFRDISGQRFGRLMAVRAVERTVRGYLWLCTCDCGKETLVGRSKLESGHTRSCGCLIDEGRRQRAKHGGKGTPEYRVWLGMRARCQCPTNKRYAYYGGRGIKICPEWDDFAQFRADVGAKPSDGHELDRIDTDGDYHPSNVRWATKKVQLQNRRVVVHVTIDGVKRPLSEWARQFGIDPKLAWQRYIKRGWDIRRALTTDPKEYHNNY